MATTEVKAELTLDSNADAVLGEIQKDLSSLRDEFKAAQSGLTQFGTTLGALVVHDAFMPMVRGARDMVTASFELSSAAYDAQQGMAGMMAGMSGKEWADARGAAEFLYEDLQQISIATGEAKEGLLAAHSALRTFLGGDEHAFDVATRNMGDLATIANVTGINVNELGMQFGKMSAGFVSMESPVFNLLKTTGIFSADITKVNAEWQKLTGEERIKRLEGAIGSVAANLQTAAPTVSDIVTSMKETGHAFMESFGGAFIREVIDELEALRGQLVAGGDQFEDFSKSLGKDFGKEVAVIINDLIEAAEYFREHGDEIADNIREAFTFAKDTIKFMVDNAGLLASIAGAGALGKNDTARGIAVDFAKGALGRVASPVAGAAGVAGEVGGVVPLASRAGQAIPGLISAIVAGGPPIWAASAAVVALGAGAAYLSHQAGKEEAKQRDRIEELMKKEHDRFRELHQLSEEEHDSRTRDMKELIALAHELGEETEQLRKFKAIGADKRADLARDVTPYTVEAGNYARMAAEPLTNAQLLADTEMKAVQQMTEGLRHAVQTGDTEVSKALLKVLLEDEKLKSAFMKTADTIAIGADGLRMAMQGLEEMNFKDGYLHKHFADILGTLETPKAQVNFNGGQKFEIQQDFRDQDPDAIAVAFERKFTQTAVSRVQASTSAPFGA